jgi:alpha-mannosidase
MGWLVSYAEERNFGLYSYLAHLDRVNADPQYRFVMSEIPHLITMMEYEPERLVELKRRIAEGRVELVNAFVLEPTVSLSGGEALVQQGVLGLRWYEQVLQQKPRTAWMIDLCGWHEQMAQITKQLGLEALVYCRFNPTGPPPTGTPALTNWDEVKSGSALHWAVSPDGSRVLAVSPGLYCDVEFQPLFRSLQAVGEEELRNYIAVASANRQRFPSGIPPIIFGGEWDYSLPFRYPRYPAELIPEWDRLAPDMPLRLTTFGAYLDAVLPLIRDQNLDLPTATASSKYGWSAFWVSMPRVKQRYRRDEHLLQAAELLTTIGSLHGQAGYPSQEFADSWFLMALNMDRNVLWGAGVDASFADPNSWDASDRFDYVEANADQAMRQSLQALSRDATDSIVLFNPANQARRAPVELQLPAGQTLAGSASQSLDNRGTTLVELPLEPMSLTSLKLTSAGPLPAPTDQVPAAITTDHYVAQVDSTTGALISLRLKPSGREVLGGPANVVLLETKSDPHALPAKAQRARLASSSESRSTIQVTEGPVATIVEVRSPFHGGSALRRVMRFYRHSPRIDFVTATTDLPDGTVVSVEFPLAETIQEVHRGIPFGFSVGDASHPDAPTAAMVRGIVPAIRYSDYALKGGGGVALLDRGVPGRELVGNTPLLLLHNVCDAYALTWRIHDREFSQPSAWMSGRGTQTYEYALLAHEQDWEGAEVPQWAWEYNSPVIAQAGFSAPAAKFCDTSSNVIIESIRRVDDEIEVRLVECLGLGGKGRIQVHLPHTAAVRTDVRGENRVELPGGPAYELELRPQEIVTLRLSTAGRVPAPEAIRSFERLIPASKRAFMRNAKNPNLVGHPPAAD